MLNFVEYIAKRKKEDNLNEFDHQARAENMRICVNYVFEYFNNYLGDEGVNEATILHSEKLEKFRNQLERYEPSTQDWVVSIFDEHGKKVNQIINNFLKKQDLFWLYNSDSEFRSLSYDCYSRLSKKYPFLKEHTEMLFVYIREYHQIMSHEDMVRQSVYINEAIDEWIEQTWTKHRVNLLLFAFDWIDKFYDNENTWPVTHRIKSTESWRKYEYDYRQKSNLFNLNDLYKRIPKKSFIKGRKQELEILMMYYWLHSIEGDEEYWDEYLSLVLPSM
ncbi:hypothetical protein D3C87_1178250 [compost metagenome]